MARHCVAVILCNTVTNITVSVPDDVYRAARIRAAEQGSSVSALVAEYLRSLSEREAEFARLEAQQRDIHNQIDRFSARDRLDREELHGRAVR
jgi:plasmid stability protein